jgi:hypothetical protein
MELARLAHELSLNDALRFRRSMKYTFGKESKLFYTSVQEYTEMGSGTMYYFTFLKIFAVYGVVSTLVMLPAFGLFLRGEGIPEARRDGLGLAVLSYGSLGLGMDASAAYNDSMAHGPWEDEWTDAHAVAQLVSYSDLACSALFFVALLLCHHRLNTQAKHEFERRSQAADYSVFVEGLPAHASENQVIAFFSNQYDCSKGHREWPMHFGCFGVRAPQSSESAQDDPVISQFKEGRLAPVSDLQHCCEDQRYQDSWVAEVALCTRNPPLLQLRTTYAQMRSTVVDLQREIATEKTKALEHDSDMAHSHMESAAAHRLAEANDYMSDHRTKWLNRAACETELQRVMREELHPLDAKMSTLAQLHEQWRRLRLYRREYGLRASAVRKQQRTEAQASQQRPRDADVTGAFVVFNNSLSRALCLHDYRHSVQWLPRALQPPGLRFKDLGGKCYPLRITPAPAPSEVIWGEHVDTTSWTGSVTVVWRRAVGNGLLLAVLGGSVVAAYLVCGDDTENTSGVSSNSSSDYGDGEGSDDAGYGGDVVLLQAAVVLVCNLLLEWTVSPAARVQAATSTTAPSTSCNPVHILIGYIWALRGVGIGGYASTRALAESTAQKLFASELFNTAAVALLVSFARFGDDSTSTSSSSTVGFEDGGVRWLSSAGATITAASVTLAALPLLKAMAVLGADWWSVWRVKRALGSRTSAAKAGESKHVRGVHNQAELNDLLSPPRFELHGRYPAVSVALCVTVALGGAMPFLHPALALTCTVSFLVDRTLLLRACGHVPPPQSAGPSSSAESPLPRPQPHDLRSARACVQLLPFALLVRVCVAVWIHSSAEIWTYSESEGKIRFAAASSAATRLDLGRLTWPTVLPHLALGGLLLLWMCMPQLVYALQCLWFLPSTCAAKLSPDGGEAGTLTTTDGGSGHHAHAHADAHAQHHAFVRHLSATALAHSPYSLIYKQRLDPRQQRRPLTDDEVQLGWCYHTETEDWQLEQTLRRKREEETETLSNDAVVSFTATSWGVVGLGGRRESVRVVERALDEARAQGEHVEFQGMKRLLGLGRKPINEAGAGSGASSVDEVSMLVDLPTPAISVTPAKSKFGPPAGMLIASSPTIDVLTPGEEVPASDDSKGLGEETITPGPTALVLQSKTSPRVSPRASLGGRRKERARIYLVHNDSDGTFNNSRRRSRLEPVESSRRGSKEALPPLTQELALVTPEGVPVQEPLKRAHRWEWRKDCVAMAESITHSLEHHMQQKGEAQVEEDGGRRKSVVEELQELERGLVKGLVGSTKATLAEKLQALELEKTLKEEQEKAARNKPKEIIKPSNLTWQLMQGVPSYRMHRHPAIRPLVLLSPFLRMMEDEHNPNETKHPNAPKRKQSVSKLPVERRRSLKEDWSKDAPTGPGGDNAAQEKERAARAAGIVRATEVCVDDEHMSSLGALYFIAYHALLRPLFGGGHSNANAPRRTSVFGRKSSTEKIHVSADGAKKGTMEEGKAAKAMKEIKSEVESRIPATSDPLHEPAEGETFLRLTICQARGLEPWKKPGADGSNLLTKRKKSVATAQFEGTYVAVSCANRNKKTAMRYLTAEPRFEHTFEFDVTRHLARPDDHPDGRQACKVAVWMQDASTDHSAHGTGDRAGGSESWVGEVVLPLKSLREGFIKGDWRQGIDSKKVEEGAKEWHKIYRTFTEHKLSAVSDKSQIQSPEAKELAAAQLAGLASNGTKSLKTGEVLLKFGFVSKAETHAMTWREAEAQRLEASADAGRRASQAAEKEHAEALELLTKAKDQPKKQAKSTVEEPLTAVEKVVGLGASSGGDGKGGKAKEGRKQSTERVKVAAVKKKDKPAVAKAAAAKAAAADSAAKAGTPKPKDEGDPEIDPYDGSYAPLLEGWTPEWDVGRGGWYYWKEVFGASPETVWERPVDERRVRRKMINERKAKQMEELFNEEKTDKEGETTDEVERRLANRRKSVGAKLEEETQKEELMVAYRKKQEKLGWEKEKNEREWHIASNRAEVANMLAAKHAQNEEDKKNGVTPGSSSKKKGRKGSGAVQTWDYKRAMQETESAVAAAKKEVGQ